MKPATPQTEPSPSTQLRKVVFGGYLKIIPVMKPQSLIACLAALLSLTGPAGAGIITTNVTSIATVAYVSSEGGSSSGGVSQYAVTHVFDGVTDESVVSPITYWKAASGDTNGSFILDLQRAFPIRSLYLFNTHDQGSNDCGTANFQVLAANAIAPVLASVDRYYGLDGATTDQSGNGVDATSWPSSAVFSNDVPATIAGHSTKAIYLDGVYDDNNDGQSLQIPDPAGFNQPTAYAYALWVKFLTNDVQPTLQPTSLILRTTGAGAENYGWSHMLILTPSFTFASFVYDSNLGSTASGTTVVQPNVWYHVACTVQAGGQNKIYVNGVLEGTASGVGTLWGGGTITELGTGYNFGNFHPAAELLDDVVITYTTLTAGQILQLSQGTSPLSIAQIVGQHMVSPTLLVSNVLSDVSGQDQITPDVFNLDSPVTARYVQFQALSSIYPTHEIGLNEIQVVADVETPTLTNASGIELTWPVNPFAAAPLTSPSLSSPVWSALAAQPVLTGTNFIAFLAPTKPTAFFALAGPANNGSANTNVAYSGTILAASGTLDANHMANHAIDGSINEGTNAPSSFWLATATNGATTPDFILDLQRDYHITSVSLYNTHDGAGNDYGTAQFELYAGDAISVSATNVDRIGRS